ncbi:glycosyltransferase family 9 protein [Lentzea aerocolonigenes]|uniref:glycosyltransferase family 9 protein n=1 Tax=Lentzea aerocolonigenes TaxID=68170 RepID=UPI00191C0D38|nr:glycosyltransferase family 9 protein [Lentzea aerocolonigenes]
MRILVLRALGLGDLLTAVPALRGLRAAFPQAEITLAAPGWLADAVERIEAVDRLLPTEALAPIGFEKPDLAVNLHGRGPQSVERLLETGPRALITYGGPDRAPEVRLLAVEWPEDRHEVLRWCDLLQRTGIRCDPDDFRLRPVGDRTGRIVIHPGASTGARRWPAGRFAAVARALGDDVVVTAGPGEHDLARQITPNPFTGTLSELMDLVATARLVICGDTGIAHVATAYRTPSVLLFGPVSPHLWGPRHGPHQVLWHGGTGDTFADEPDPGLLKITTEEVLDAAGGVLCGPGESESSARVTSV